MSSDVQLRRRLAALVGELATSLALTPPDTDRVSVRLPHPFSNMTRRQWTHSIQLWRTEGAHLLSDLPPRACPACGGHDADPLFTSYDAYPYAGCTVCGTWFVPLRITGELFERYFERTPAARQYGDYTQVQNDDASVQALDRERFTTYFADLRSSLDRPLASMLDIGCGVGNSLAVAKELGIDACGLEVNIRAIAAAQAAGRSVFVPGSRLPRPMFDVVTMWETIEHLEDPLSTLRSAKTLIAPQGMLAITAPNLDSPVIRGMRSDSMQIHGGPAWPGHINLFTPGSLTTLLKRAGLRVVDVRGQFTANIYELAAYHLGSWLGARSYLSGADDAVEMPAAVKAWLDAIAPGLAYAEEAFSFAPIIRVIAVREEDSTPRALAAYQDAQHRRTVERLLSLARRSMDEAQERRGRTMSFESPTYIDPIAELKHGRLSVNGAPSAPFAYLWKSAATELNAGDIVRLRGRLYGGGISFGLQTNERWGETCVCEAPGPFELAVRVATSGLHDVVIANQSENGTETNVDCDAIEIVSAASTRP